MKKGELELKNIEPATLHTRKDNLLEEVTEVSVSADGSWHSRGFLLRHGLVNICSEETGKIIDVILKKNYFKTCSNIKAQKDAGSMNLLEYLEKSAKHEAEYLLNHDGSSAVDLPLYILFVIL